MFTRIYSVHHSRQNSSQVYDFSTSFDNSLYQAHDFLFKFLNTKFRLHPLGYPEIVCKFHYSQIPLTLIGVQDCFKLQYLKLLNATFRLQWLRFPRDYLETPQIPLLSNSTYTDWGLGLLANSINRQTPILQIPLVTELVSLNVEPSTKTPLGSL